tara:strand:- start:434 stop:550 length:117 start_codon:yes stop_codon:yes gene_type:complete
MNKALEQAEFTNIAMTDAFSTAGLEAVQPVLRAIAESR